MISNATDQPNINSFLLPIFTTNDSISEIDDLATAAPPPITDAFTSHETEELIQEVVDLYMNSILSYFGVITNALNIYIFRKMGYRETMNISLTIIAIWDLLRCFCFAFIRLYGPISLTSPVKAESWKNLMSVNFGLAYTIAGYVSSVLAGYVAVERCLCISKPFTVKWFLTKKMVIWTGVILSVIVTGSYAIVYSLYSFTWEYSAEFNASIYVFRYSEFALENPSVVAYINGIGAFWPIFSLVVTCVCTAVISHHLRKASRFRSDASVKSLSSSMVQFSVRDKKVIKMMLVIIAVYIVCNLPRIGYVISYQVVPGFHNRGRYHNTMWVHLYIMSLFDILNASTNIIVYYFMSTPFRRAFWRHLLCCCNARQGNHCNNNNRKYNNYNTRRSIASAISTISTTQT